MKKPRWTEKENKLFIEKYPNASKKELSKLFPNRSPEALHCRAQYVGIEKAYGFSGQRQNNVEVLLGETLDIYYWIGFLMADGCFVRESGTISLSCAEKDKTHIKKYCKLINDSMYLIDGGVGFENYKSQNQITVSSNNKFIVPTIMDKFGIFNRKTYNPPNLEILNKTLNTNEKFLSFLIGFIDGDGYIYKNISGIKIENHSSWKIIHEFFHDRLTEYFGPHTLPKINSRGYSDYHIPKHCHDPIIAFAFANLKDTILMRKYKHLM